MTNRIRWGILGNALIARTQLIPAIQRSVNGEVVGIASRASAPRAAADEFGIKWAFASYEELLAHPEIDAVYIPVPNSEHVPWVIKAAAAGKHVLCEKPLALSLGEWDQAVAACADAGVQLLEAFMYRFHPQHQMVRDLIAAGVIGDVSAIHSSFHFDIGDLRGSNVRLQGPLGGGALNDLGCYTVDIATSLLGRAPESVFATAQFAPDDPTVDVSTGGTLNFGTVQATFNCGFQGTGNSYWVTGNAGRIEVPYAFRPDERGGVGVVRVHREESSEEHVVIGDQYRLQVEAFAQAISAGTGLADSLQQSRNTTQTLDGLRSSLTRGVPTVIRG